MAAVGNRHNEIYKQHTANGHDWEEEKRQHNDFQDDGTMSFFWQRHSLIVLGMFSCFLMYFTIFEEPDEDSSYSVKRGIIAMIGAFLLFGIVQIPNGPFRRPHPAFWKLILCISIVYELALVFLLFQRISFAREALLHFDSSLNQPLQEKNYSSNCLLIDLNHTNILHNVWDRFDLFVIAHFFGWWTKTVILRDWKLCMVQSIIFEILEYTLQNHLPNFNECWWDQVLMDLLLCNGIGIYLGSRTLKYLKTKSYHWRGMQNIPTYSGKIKRVALQFTPYSWIDFDWKPTSSLKRWLFILILTVFFMVAEMNTFFLKFVLWIPPNHFLVVARLLIFFCMGAISMREVYQYLEDPNCKSFGNQVWIIVVIISTELAIFIKYDWETVTKPIPESMLIFWTVGLICLVLWTIWEFFIKRCVQQDMPTGNTPSSVKQTAAYIEKDRLEKEQFKNGSSKGGELRSRSKKSLYRGDGITNQFN